MYFWTNQGTIEAEDMEACRQKAIEIGRPDLNILGTIPYPAVPILWQSSLMPAFCWQPEKCVGRTSCPRRKACDD